MFPTRLSITHNLTLAEIIERLRQQPEVTGLVTMGTTGSDHLRPESDYDLVVVLAEMPVALHVALTTVDGRGAIPEDHPLCIGNYYTSAGIYNALDEADLTIAVGTKYAIGVEGGSSRFKPPGKHLQIDIDPNMVGRNMLDWRCGGCASGAGITQCGCGELISQRCSVQ